MKQFLRVFLSLAGGFGLSFVAFGVLWAGAPWRYQALMFVPFFLLAFAVTRTGAPGDTAFLFVVFGAAPLGAIISMFRDKNDSHLMSILTVCTWLAGTVSGHYLAATLMSRRNR